MTIALGLEAQLVVERCLLKVFDLIQIAMLVIDSDVSMLLESAVS